MNKDRETETGKRGNETDRRVMDALSGSIFTS